MTRTSLAAAAVLAVLAIGAAAAAGRSQQQQPQPRPAQAAGARDSSLVVVYKSPTCGCCGKWVDHMRAAGFRMEVHDTSDVAAVKRRLGVASALESCHTSTVGGYVLEGHVPADLVRRMLRERPQILGLAAPGMPAGSPGMDVPNSPPFEVVAFARTGRPSVYATVTPPRR